MENFQDSIHQHLSAILREAHWHEAGLDNIPIKLVRAESKYSYSSACWDCCEYDCGCYDYDDYYYSEDEYLGEVWGPPKSRPYDSRSNSRYKLDWRQYSFKCKIGQNDHWDLYVLSNHSGGWYLHKCGISGTNRVFLTNDFYDLTPEIIFGKVMEILVMSVMEDV